MARIKLPGLNKSSTKATGQEEVVDEREERVRALKPQERLSTVVKESTPNSALQAIRENEPFLIEDGNAGVVLLLDVLDIGGLSKKHSKDMDKGGVASQIGADHIRVVVSEQMLEDQLIGIIPDASTLDRMKEFSLLMQAPYRWARVDLTGTQISIQRSKGATFNEALLVSRGSRNILDVLAEDVSDDPTVSIDAVPDADDNTVAAEAAATQDPQIEDDSPFGEENDQVNTAQAVASNQAQQAPDEEVPEGFDENDFDPAVEAEAEGLGLGLPEDFTGVDDEDTFDPDAHVDYSGDDEGTAEEAGDYGWVPPAEAIDADAVRDSIARRFTSEDLELLVDLDPFEKQFGIDEPLALFEIEADVSDWLGQQVAYLQEQANSDLRDFHRKNVIALQEMYVRLSSRHAEQVLGQVDTTKTDLRYGKLMGRAKERFDKARDDAARDIAQRQTELRSAFTERMEDYVRTSAEQARTVYRERHHAQLDHEIAAVPSKVSQEQESAYAEDRRETLSMRAREAQASMDVGITRVLSSLTEQNQANLEAGLELRRKWDQRITEFLDEHRKDDVARIDALAEKQAREDEVSRIQSEMASQLELQRRESTSQLESLNAELRRTREESESRLSAREAELRGMLDNEIQRTEQQRVLAQNAEANVEARVHDRYAGRLEDLESANDRMAKENERTVMTNLRKDRILITLMIALALVAVFAGIMIGFLWSGSVYSGGEASASAGLISVAQAGGSGVS